MTKLIHEAVENERQEYFEDFEELVESLVMPGEWDDGTSIGIWRNRLVIRHTVKAHGQVLDLLNLLRKVDKTVESEAVCGR